VGDSDEWERFKGGGGEFSRKKQPLGIGGIYPHYSGVDGLFFRGREKEGVGLGN
jgi:hypothetical protein